MLFETTLASAVSVLIEALEKHYGIDARPVLEAHGLDLSKLHVPGARYPDASLDAAVAELITRTGDPCFGLVVGRHIRPTSIHALGYAWLASDTLRDAFHRLARFDRMVFTGEHIEMAEEGDLCCLRIKSRVPQYVHLAPAIDAYFTATLRLCRIARDGHFSPVQVRLVHGDFGRAADYVAAFDAPVQFEAEVNELQFDRAQVAERLPGANVELATLSDRVAEAYLESLDADGVARQVRELLVTMLPSGEATQEEVARKLARSTSALQRQLRAEGTSFQQLRDETRREIAVGHLRAGDLSLTEIAFLVGFTDQSNFSRAFRRWTGVSPRRYRARLH